jgi:hypothetical protein
MSDKIYIRKVERFTQWAASEPIEIDVEKLRQCEPPYEGNTNEELMMYLKDNVYQNFDWSESNQEVYENSYDLTFDDTELEVYSDTRMDWEESWLEVGVPNEEYRKVGKFEKFVDTMPEDNNNW